MNKYAAIGLAYAAAVEGHRILLVTDPRERRNALNELSAVAVFSEGARIRRTNGSERIDYPSGGTIRITTPRSSGHRGFSAVTVYMDEGTGHDVDPVHNLLPCLNASPRGELIRA